MTEQYFIGVDVGTGSARAGIFDANGNMISSASRPIRIWKPRPDFVQQSSEDIWLAVYKSVKEALKTGGVRADDVKGIGFDATCSLVALGRHDEPLSVSPDGEPDQNIIVWMDHRAKGDAEEINQTGHEVLKYVGGIISPEMQTPKLLWLKKNMPGTWRKSSRFLDLPDYLVYRATGADVRSACTTTCKWTYLCHEDSTTGGSIGAWDESYFKEIGLEDLVEEQYRKIGTLIRPIGEPAGQGLTKQSAGDLGLEPGTPVGVAIIDAHAGGLGLLGMKSEDNTDIQNRIALIGGTSSCHMAVSEEPVFIEGVWGPYYSAMIPGLWLNEGGQSATGALIDHVILSSSHTKRLKDQAEKEGSTVYDLLNKRLVKLAEDREIADIGLLTKDLHVLPYFHGNRSPRADPFLTGGTTGLTLSDTPDDLALLYLAVIQAIACGTRHIIESMNEKGYAIRQIVATGGGTKNEIFLRQHADICGCDVILAKESEAVLLGSAVLGSVAAGMYRSVSEAMRKMNHTGRIIRPEHEKSKKYHDSKYKVFLKMYEDQISYKKIMEDV